MLRLEEASIGSVVTGCFFTSIRADRRFVFVRLYLVSLMLSLFAQL